MTPDRPDGARPRRVLVLGATGTIGRATGWLGAFDVTAAVVALAVICAAGAVGAALLRRRALEPLIAEPAPRR